MNKPYTKFAKSMMLMALQFQYTEKAIKEFSESMETLNDYFQRHKESKKNLEDKKCNCHIKQLTTGGCICGGE